MASDASLWVNLEEHGYTGLFRAWFIQTGHGKCRFTLMLPQDVQDVPEYQGRFGQSDIAVKVTARVRTYLAECPPLLPCSRRSKRDVQLVGTLATDRPGRAQFVVYQYKTSSTDLSDGYGRALFNFSAMFKPEDAPRTFGPDSQRKTAEKHGLNIDMTCPSGMTLSNVYPDSPGALREDYAANWTVPPLGDYSDYTMTCIDEEKIWEADHASDLIVLGTGALLGVLIGLLLPDGPPIAMRRDPISNTLMGSDSHLRSLAPPPVPAYPPRPVYPPRA
jgi:hypothetical protein